MKGERKKLMLLGGLRYLLPVIEAAHKLDIYVITVDYIPDNIAHKYSDEYHNVSILDKNAILSLAKELKIDGIMSFAVDPGVITAAYVAEKLNLPFQGSYESICILQDKARFRRFLTDNSFNVPKSKGYDDIETALKEAEEWVYPIIVKPVDSAGSKGVKRVNSPQDLENAILNALNASYHHRFIIEEFIEQEGCSSDSDSFSVDGILKVCSFSDQYFDPKAENPYTPSAYSWPSSMQIRYQRELRKELQRLMTLLNMKTGIYNIETRVGKDGKAYIMEVSPRGGGNRLAEMVDIAGGTHLVENSVRSAVGLPLPECNEPKYKDYLIEVILHSDKSGSFESLEISESFKPYIIQTDLWVKKGEKVSEFKGANNAIGTLVLKLQDPVPAKKITSDFTGWWKINVKPE